MLRFSKDDTNAVKGAAIILLIIYHCFSSEERLNGYAVEFLFPNGMHLAVLADICVAIFVFLSVFGITRAVEGRDPFATRTSARQFLVHRLLKLYMEFWPVAIVCIAVTYALGNHWYHNYTPTLGWMYFLQDLFCLVGLFDSPTICGTWWYMSFALLIVLLYPLFYRISKMHGVMLTVLVMVLPIEIGMYGTVMCRHLPLIPMAMYFAENNVLERIREASPFKHRVLDDAIKIVLFGVLTYVFAEGAMNETIYYNYRFLFHPLSGASFVIFSYLTYTRIPYVNQVFRFLGKYSMNMFLMHTFVRSKWLVDFTYGLGKDYLILLFMVAVSLAFSIAMEGLKKLIRYGAFEKAVENKVLAWTEKLGGGDANYAV